MIRPENAAATLYRCARCHREFVSAPIAVARVATDRPVSHCGAPAWFVRNLTTAELRERADVDRDARLARERRTTETGETR